MSTTNSGTGTATGTDEFGNDITATDTDADDNDITATGTDGADSGSNSVTDVSNSHS